MVDDREAVQNGVESTENANQENALVEDGHENNGCILSVNENGVLDKEPETPDDKLEETETISEEQERKQVIVNIR